MLRSLNVVWAILIIVRCDRASRSRRCCSCAGGRPKAATSRTAIARPGSSACWRPGSRCCSGSSSSSPSRATTSRGAAPSRRRSILVQQVENAQFFPRPAAGELTGELVCYGRSVVNDEWEQDARRHAGRRDQPVGREAVSHVADGAAADRDPAVCLRQVARPDIGAGGGAPRSHPRRRRRDSRPRSGSCCSSSRP